MARNLKWKVVAGAGAALAVAGGGAAVAATQFTSPKAESQAVVDDAAKQLGVTPSKLSDALKQALENRVDAAVAAGRLTKDQGDALKARIESGDYPLFGGPAVGGFGRGLGLDHHAFGFAGLDAAASYLGLTETQLRKQLESGKTLGEIAKAQGKTVDGLVDALVTDAKQKLDDAVTAGRLTKDQEQQVLSDLKQRYEDLANGKLPSFDNRPGFRFHLGRPAGTAPLPPVGPTM